MKLTKGQERDISDLTTRIKNNEAIVGDTFWIGKLQFKIIKGEIEK